jgi:hypothetical protein
MKQMTRKYSFMIAMVGLAISIFNSMSLSCACGHLDFVCLPGNLIGLALAWYALLVHTKIGIFKRSGIDAACVFTTLILFKNIADILWLGHNPVLG